MALLAAVAVPGLIGIAAVAPNILQVLGGRARNKHKFTYRLKSVAGRLAEDGLVRFVSHGEGMHIEITPAGRAELDRRMEYAQRKRRWDKRWRVIIFDIPERRRGIRDSLRRSVEEYGFVRLQASVWVYPYDCEEVIALLKAELHTGGSVLYMIVESIENDSWLRGHFEL